MPSYLSSFDIGEQDKEQDPFSSFGGAPTYSAPQSAPASNPAGGVAQGAAVGAAAGGPAGAAIGAAAGFLNNYLQARAQEEENRKANLLKVNSQHQTNTNNILNNQLAAYRSALR